MIFAHIDKGEQLLKSIVGMLLSIFLLSWLLKKFRQPYFIAYIIAGILLGPYGLKLFTDINTIAQIGALGLMLQMFFIGAEIEVGALMKNIKTLTVGAGVQLALSFLLISVIGMQLSWSWNKITLFSFIITMSSSAIIFEFLQKNREINTRFGTITAGILILQDFLLVPMIMVLNFMGKGESSVSQLVCGVLITLAFVFFLKSIILKRKVKLSFMDNLRHDHELQLFVGLLLCFGFAWITSLLNLSAALGAMFAGMIISHAKSTEWLDKTLVPFRVFFLSLFFFSIGLQIKLGFMLDHAALIIALVLLILVLNSGINALVFRFLKEPWQNSLYAGALLSQIGEFSLVLCTVARELQLVDDFSFQLTLAVISVTMLFTSAWVGVIRAFLFPAPARG